MPLSSTSSTERFAVSRIVTALALVLVLFGMTFVVNSPALAAPALGTPVPSTGKGVETSHTPPSTSAVSPSSGNCNQSSSGTLANPLKFCSLNELLDGVLKAVIELGSIILTIALIYTGFLFVAARGNEEKISKAKTALMYTIIGGLIILGATAIKEVISSTVTSLTP